MGPMETRDAGGLAPRWRGTSSRQTRRRQRRSRALQRGALATLRSAGGVCHHGAPTREPPRRAKGKNSGCRKRKKQAPLPLSSPQPFPASQLGAAETSGAPRKHAHRAGVHCVFRVEALYLPGRRVCFLRLVAGVTEKTTAAAAPAASLIRALGNNFPPRAPRPRKLLYHFRVVVTDALRPSSGGLAGPG